jgi:hypothetical protein
MKKISVVVESDFCPKAFKLQASSLGSTAVELPSIFPAPPIGLRMLH